MILKTAFKDAMALFGIKVRVLTEHEKFLKKNAVRRLVNPNSMLSERKKLNLLLILDRAYKRQEPGCFVECGVWKGGAAALVALYIKEMYQSEITLHLFDSFTDIVEPDASVDGERAIREAGGIEQAQGRLVSSNIYKRLDRGHGESERVRKLIAQDCGYEPNKVVIHKGWFQKTLPKLESIEPIIILHLDGDWYSSTKVCLDHLYDRVVPGGAVIIDDYYAYSGCQLAVDEFLKRRTEFVRFQSIDKEAIWWIKGGGDSENPA